MFKVRKDAIFQNRKQFKKFKQIDKRVIDLNHATRRNTLLMSTANYLLLRQMNVGGSLLGLIGFYFVNKNMHKSRLDQFKQSMAKGQPYFESPQQVVDLKRTFFHIDDDKNYSPSLFYPGRNLDNLKPSGLIQLLQRQQQ